MTDLTVPLIVVEEPLPASADYFARAVAGLDGIGVWLGLIAEHGESTRTTLRSLARSLVDEGRRYAATPDGARWAALLAGSPAVERGWLLWNHANADFYLRNAEPLPDSPGALFGAVLRELADTDLATLLGELSRIGAEWEMMSENDKEHR
ncbi:hypothetical protein [Paraburkholderia caballeronis]|uniref:Uncharacterized protein n=1 Tax=Paraburkholderia caballeronis TaxID=416943 RepID=A0A1H7L9E1_9BURK|nr:hypothetical protein [Paraburkholderia caballeronis]PXW28362.1 hypothetical protein C7403_102254 [Paraburkholderia caballeronis]PXX03728.1 hypothetical protein C7407_102254 [Paraburkholderia caballeronis]RAK04472.1 hypothetical protein C7409_102254 [Paraburkholderia caballeronis]TDV19377.1 hypothetical protein C7408_102120 [Paraburkholderia caballeronis]TDV21977.1 hypothetical protein C7406_101120 [Paraburkholderia caballeronis]